MGKQGYKTHLLFPVLAGIMVLALLAGCSAPPNQKIADAQAALEKARAGGAEKYAQADYTKAKDLLGEALTFNKKAFYFEAERSAGQAQEAAKKAEETAAKNKAQAKLEAGFEVQALESSITTIKGMLANAKKEGASDKDLAEVNELLKQAEEILADVKTQMTQEFYLLLPQEAKKGQDIAAEAEAKAFALLQKVKKGAEKPKEGVEKAKEEAVKPEDAAKAKAQAKLETNFEISAAEAAIKTAESMINKASATKKAGATEMKKAKTQIAEAKGTLENAKTSLQGENYEDAKQKGIMARELAEQAGSSAFEAIAMSKKVAK